MTHPSTDSLPSSHELLERGRRFEAGVEAQTIQGLYTGGLGKRAHAMYVALGDGISLLTAVASCGLGCRNGDHLIENLVRRFVNYVLGAFRLACRGYYDESVGLARNAAEILNLLQLFDADPSVVSSWPSLDDAARRKRYCPIEVRKQIEGKGGTPLIDQQAYAVLCDAGVHISPTSAKQTHDLEGDRVYVGPQLSVPGVIMILSELSYMVGHAVELTAQLVNADEAHLCASKNVKATLLAAVDRGEMRVANYQNVLRWFKEQPGDAG
jgi:hypothetical protein